MENCKFCGSNNVDFVKYVMANQNIIIRKQCFDCGFVGSTSYKKKDFDLNKLFFMDVDKRENYKEKRMQISDEKYEFYLKGKNYYQDVYLKSDEWKRKRIRFLERDNYKCRCCWSKAEAVHHITYVNIHKENDKDLISVCHLCHEKIHNNGDVFLDGIKANFGILRYDYLTKKYTNEPQKLFYEL
jgi:hypothetical protein